MTRLRLRNKKNISQLLLWLFYSVVYVILVPVIVLNMDKLTVGMLLMMLLLFLLFVFFPFLELFRLETDRKGLHSIVIAMDNFNDWTNRNKTHYTLFVMSIVFFCFVCAFFI